MNKQRSNIFSFIKKATLFVLVSAVIYFVLLGALGEILPRKALKNLNYRRGSDGHMFTRMEEAKKTKSVDILFLGSSHAYRSFDPRLLSDAGYKTFDLASSSQTPIQTEVLLNRYLKDLNPKMIVYEVYPLAFCMDGVESSVDIIANDHNDLLSLKMALAEPNARVFNALAFGLFLDVIGSNAAFHEPIMKNQDAYVAGGYVEKQLSFFKTQTYGRQQWDFKEEQFEAFERIVKLVRAKHITLLLVQAPITKGWYKSYSNYEDFDQRMDRYGKHIDFNKSMELNDSLDFYDVHHVNQNGATKFTKALIKILNANYSSSETHH